MCVGVFSGSDIKLPSNIYLSIRSSRHLREQCHLCCKWFGKSISKKVCYPVFLSPGVPSGKDAMMQQLPFKANALDNSTAELKKMAVVAHH